MTQAAARIDDDFERLPGRSAAGLELARTATAAGSAADSLGATLGRYRLERELGAGAMGASTLRSAP